ncbi:MAG TPA: bifunctional phosphopantothenoylcysteine decarboxylase/phosphopantothenate--cysteine ligase CoaBC, partial [Acidobacteriaceae bacterium]|nr:bifunctional phosphopantothenoylcysteine decarboxylase/phosphopantothenate--cysteine ligase CoaBC [Acidobacteriaceae bacterium]
ALTGRPVYTSLWTPADRPTPDAPIEHIDLAQAIEVLLIAPATANTLARLAHGLANDLLSTVYLATAAPVVLAPAMNVNMWGHPATRANVDVLRQRGAQIVEPASGYLACGMTGSGRLAEIDQIVQATLAAARPHADLAGETLLITAGGTREAIDPVRFLGNRSSGRMGHALAEAASRRGARVILVTASSLPAPAGCTAIRVETAEAMGRALEEHLNAATMVIAAAAVSDFRPVSPFSSKLHRSGTLTLELEATPDLIARVAARRRPGTLVIAFAAETENLEENARAKMLRKGVDAIVANDVSDASTGFDSERNGGLFLTANRTVVLPVEAKLSMAHRILDGAVLLRSAQDRNRTPRLS